MYRGRGAGRQLHLLSQDRQIYIMDDICIFEDEPKESLVSGKKRRQLVILRAGEQTCLGYLNAAVCQ